MKFPFLIMTKEYQFPPITNIIQKLFFPWKYIRRGTLVVSNRQFHFFQIFQSEFRHIYTFRVLLTRIDTKVL